MKTILLIEDDDVLRENTSELLKLSGYHVETATNGRSGVDLAKKILPNIIVCDVMMPILDGYNAFELLSKNMNTKYIPFIFLSAKTERKDIRKAMDMGADDYITKPFTEEELISAIESRLAKALILKDARQTEDATNIESFHNDIITLYDLKKFFNEKGQTFHFAKDDMVYGEGNNSNFIFLIKEGAIKNHKFDEDGKELITSLKTKGDLFGYTSFILNIPYQDTATAIKDTELVGVIKDDLKIILENNHKITLELIQLLTDNLSDVKEQLLQMAYSSVNKKTAATIIKFAEKLNTQANEAIKISRSDLASVAGIATETLIRTLSNFKKEGLIETEGRNIKILDINRLRQLC